MKNAVEIQGIYYSEIDNMFVNGLIKLVEGRHITKEDENKVLIHKRLAELNSLKLGDTISIEKSKISDENAGGSDKKVDLVVVGIFDSEIKQEANMASELVDNVLIGSMNVMKELYEYTDETLGYRQANNNMILYPHKRMNLIKYQFTKKSSTLRKRRHFFLCY